MVEHVGGLLGDTLVGLLPRCAGNLLGFLLHLGPDQLGIGEQRRGVRPVRPLGGARRDRPLERRKHLVRRGRLEVAAVEAGPLAGVTGGSRGLDERQQGIAVAVDPQCAERLGVPRGRALVPELLARAAEEMHLPRLPGEPQRLGVHVRERQHLAGAGILHDAGHEAPLVKNDLGVVHRSRRF